MQATWRQPPGGAGGAGGRARLPAVYVMTSHLTDDQLRRLYKAADAFVLPSRCPPWHSSPRLCCAHVFWPIARRCSDINSPLSSPVQRCCCCCGGAGVRGGGGRTARPWRWASPVPPHPEAQGWPPCTPAADVRLQAKCRLQPHGALSPGGSGGRRREWWQLDPLRSHLHPRPAKLAALWKLSGVEHFQAYGFQTKKYSIAIRWRRPKIFNCN